MFSDLVFMNTPAPPVLAVILLMSGIFLFLAYHRFSVAARPAVRAALLALRAVLMLILFFILLDPYWSRQKESEWIGVLVDTSSSMAVRDEAGGRSRLEAVQHFLRENQEWKRLGQGTLKRFTAFDAQVRSVSPEDLLKAAPSGTESRLSAAVREIGRTYGEDPGVLGWIVFSDGAATDAEAGEDALFGGLTFPWVTVSAGASKPVGNLSLKAPVVRDFAFTHEKIPVEAGWTSTFPPETPVELTVQLDGETLFQKKMKAGAGRDTFEVTAEGEGPHALDARIRVLSSPAESDSADNQARAWFQTGKRRLKIFYAESFYKDRNFFKEALEEDPVFSVDFASSLIGFAKKYGTPFIRDGAHGLPRTREGLLAYDAVVLSDVKRNLLTPDQIRWIRELVEKEGGALVMVGGVDSFGDGGYSGSEIEKLLPVEISDVYKKDVYLAAKGTVENPFRAVVAPGEEKNPLLRLTGDEARNALLWNTLPNLGGYNYVGRIKPGAKVLLQHPADVSSYGPRVILAEQTFGEGKVMAFTSDVTPNWGQWFQEWRTPEEGWLYASFWRNVFLRLTEKRSRRALVPFEVILPQELEEGVPSEWTAVLPAGSGPASGTSIQFEVFQGRERVRFLDPAPVSSQGKFTWAAGSFKSGDYRLRAVLFENDRPALSVEKSFFVQAPRLESRKLTAEPAVLEKLAGLSQGVSLTLSDARLEDALRKIRKVHLKRRSAPAWHHPLVFLLILGILSADWFLRKKKGLE